MRIDKFLKVSRVIKRRTVADEACSKGRVKINDKVAKSSSEVKVGDIVTIGFGDKEMKFEVLIVSDVVRAEDASKMIKVL